jgi:hypothetical protein
MLKQIEECFLDIISGLLFKFFSPKESFDEKVYKISEKGF